MFFSLTAPRPASPGFPLPAATARALLPGPHARSLASPWTRGAQREGGREAGREAAARPGTDLLCAQLSQRSPPAGPPGPPRRLLPARRPPCAHPGAHPGALTFWAPASRPGCCLSPGRPATSSAAAACPTLLPARRAWHRARLPGSPARAGGRGAAVPGEGEAQMPGRPTGPPPSPE